MCQGTPGCTGSASQCAGTHQQWTFGACNNGTQTEYIWGAHSGALKGTEQVACVTGTSTASSPAPSSNPSTSNHTQHTRPSYHYTGPTSGGTATPLPIVSSSPPACPYDDQLQTQTTYTTQTVCTPVTQTVSYTYDISIPYTLTGVRYEEEPYTVYERVPVWTEIWSPRALCINTTCYGGMVDQIRYEEQAVTQWHAVPEYYSYTAYRMQIETEWRQETIGDHCAPAQEAHTTTSCVPRTTITTTTQVVGPTAVACMPNPVMREDNGQPIAAPEGDTWVEAGGATPDTLLPGPGWAIDRATQYKVTTTCVDGTECTQTRVPDGPPKYSEAYDPTFCPYPVVTVTSGTGANASNTSN
ncbi:hypothetical protein CO251_15830 [Sulfobacillus sp. hq2]|nr:hypothetical protein CO251_15830 [Sulfobacillus sp. hq2]